MAVLLDPQTLLITLGALGALLLLTWFGGFVWLGLLTGRVARLAARDEEREKELVAARETWADMTREREQDRADRKELLDAIVLMSGRLDRAIGGITGDPESAMLPIPADRDMPPPVVPVDGADEGVYWVGDGRTASERAAAKAMAGAGQAPVAVNPPSPDDADEEALERELQRRRQEEGRGERGGSPNASWE